jgi:hypothetical protein
VLLFEQSIQNNKSLKKKRRNFVLFFFISLTAEEIHSKYKKRKEASVEKKFVKVCIVVFFLSFKF